MFSNIPLCTQPSPSVPKRGPLKVNSADLGRCISVHCERYDEKECNEIFGCFWCNREADGSLLKEPKCMSDLQCYDGVMDQENPFLLPEVPRRQIQGDRKLNKMLLIIIGSSAGGLLIIILIVVVCCLHRKKFQYEQEQMEFQAMDMLIDPTTVIDANEGFNQMSLNYPGQSKAMQSTMGLNYPGKSTVRQSKVTLNYPGKSTVRQSKMTLNYPGKGAGRQSKMTLNYPGQSTVQAPMQLNYPGQSTIQAPMQLNYPGQSTVQAPMQLNYPGQSTVQAPMQLNYPGQSTAQAPMQLNYPGQSTVMPSNMQMRLGGQDMGYSTQAMSGMWSTRYGQSQIMQTPQAPGGQRGRPTAGRRRPGPNRHVSFTDDVQHQEIQKPAPISGDEPIVTDENGDSED